MPGRVKAVVLLVLVLLSTTAAFADCSQWTAHTSAQFRTTALDLSVDGNFLWLATGYGVQLIESDHIVASIALPGPTRVVRAQGSGIAYAGSGANVLVLRRQEQTIQIVTSIAAGGTVNDLEIISTALFAATMNGIAHFDIINPAAPVKTSVLLPTSSTNVTSLATAKNKLYAADGDMTVEIFNVSVPSLPQGIGTLATIPRGSSVHATADDFIFISDRFGLSTDLFLGTTRLSTMQVGTTAFAASAGQTHFVAGPDRTLRAVDFSDPSRIAELYAASLAPTDGTDNAIHAMALVDDTLYVAAGDIGLVVLDATAIVRPYPLVSYGGGAKTSVRVNADKAWFSNGAGKITQQRLDANGLALVEERSWDAEPASLVRDFRSNGLLTTGGAKATVWSLVSTVPAQANNITFAAAISNAVMVDTHVVALLADGTVWTAPNGSTTPAKMNVPVMTLLARSGSAIALAEVRESDEKTVVHYYPTGDLTATPQQFTVDGAAAGSIALDATRAAVFTFNGISVIDVATGNIRVIAGSSLIIPRQLAFASDDLLVMDGLRLLVYDDARTLLRDHALPAEALAFDVAVPHAVMATTKGTAAVRYHAELPRPSVPFTSTFYTKLAAGSGRAYLFDDEGIDVFSTVVPTKPQYMTTVPAAFDLAATDNALYTLTNNGAVTAYSRAGVAFATVNVRDNFDSQMVAIRTAGNAVWVAIGNGCTLQGCSERKTLVLDPNTLGVTATLTGNVIDVAVSGSRAYALTSFPSEIRVLNIADPLHPSQILAAAAPASASSIAFSSGKVYVLAGKVFGYSESTLVLAEERLTAVTSAATHRIRIDGTCALVSRDTEAPVLYNLPSWTPAATQFALPSSLRSFAVQPAMLLFLTEHSLELEHPPTTPRARRRAVR
ncbi:MAG TPA: hypothetical protein VGQ76_01275 [Thermoanaerobaculia bacterium]|jgi:hypothetical protein|nr:hypothetical protein [Thermoanaerobaculia bacterium]